MFASRKRHLKRKIVHESRSLRLRHDMGCTGIQSPLDAGYDIAAIFTHPDNPGENHFFGSVARLAAEQGIPVWAPKT
ncbi:hypothetical protein LNP74_10905 [Klebsiella pneumoniae subsp. pneumoniae]|nr:hypothetical protein [Klebsiella pneumoniae subsp. pneumoniae]